MMDAVIEYAKSNDQSAAAALPAVTESLPSNASQASSTPKTNRRSQAKKTVKADKATPMALVTKARSALLASDEQHFVAGDALDELLSARRPGPASEKLALNATEAAAALGISRRLLWAETKAQNIPHVRLGSRVLYPLAELRAWLEIRSQKGFK